MTIESDRFRLGSKLLMGRFTGRRMGFKRSVRYLMRLDQFMLDHASTFDLMMIQQFLGRLCDQRKLAFHGRHMSVSHLSVDAY